MGFLDRAKKVAEQAKEMAGQAKDMAEGAIADAKEKREAEQGADAPAASSPDDSGFGTPYVPGMLGRAGWRERGLADPAAVLPIAERDRAGVPRTTKSEVVEEPFGMGRRWSAGGRSAGLFYQLYPEQREWAPPGGASPSADVAGASTTTLPDGRALVFLGSGEQRVVLEVTGLGDAQRAGLARAVAAQLG